jgi:hypothetical protein
MGVEIQFFEADAYAEFPRLYFFRFLSVGDG